MEGTTELSGQERTETTNTPAVVCHSLPSDLPEVTIKEDVSEQHLPWRHVSVQTGTKLQTAQACILGPRDARASSPSKVSRDGSCDKLTEGSWELGLCQDNLQRLGATESLSQLSII